MDCQDEDIVVMSSDALPPMTSDESRRLTRRVIQNDDPVGWEFLIESLRTGMPSYYAIDEMITMVLFRIRRTLDIDNVHNIVGELKLDFQTDVDASIVERIVIQLERMLQGKSSVFHIFLLRPYHSDDDIVSIMEALADLYRQLGDNTALVAVG